MAYPYKNHVNNLGALANTTACDTNYQDSGWAINTGKELQGVFDGGNLTEMWIHFRMNIDGGSFRDNNWFHIVDSVTGQSLVFADPNSGTTTFKYYIGSSTINLPNTLTHNGITQTIDIHYKIHATTGFVKVYVDGGLHTETGDTDTVGTLISPSAEKVRWTPPNVTTNSSVFVAEYIVGDDAASSTVGLRLVDLPADGNGTHTAFTGVYTDIDEAQATPDAAFVSSSTGGQRETFTFPALPAGVPSNGIVEVGINSLGLVNTLSDYKHSCYIGATDYDGANVGAGVTLARHFTNFTGTSPATGVNWTKAEVEASEYGLLSVA